MSFEKAGGGPGEGLFPSLRRVRVQFAADTDAGDLVMFDITNATGLTFGEGGDPGSDVLNTVIQPAASSGGIRSGEAGFYGLCEEAMDVSEQADGWVTVRGKFTDALAAAGVQDGDYLTVNAAADNMIECTASTGTKILAIACEDVDGSALCNVLFNGIEGYGIDV